MSASILNGCLFCRHRTRITTFNINSKDFGCFNCSPTALKGLGLFQSFTHRTHRPWFVSCVHPPHSKDFVCFMCSPNALKGLCFVSCVHKPHSKDSVVFVHTRHSKDFVLFHVLTNRTQRPWFVSCVHPPHSKDFVCCMCSPNALKGLCLSHVFTNRTQRTLLATLEVPHIIQNPQIKQSYHPFCKTPTHYRCP
jgi:hypothetical protein